MNRFTPLRSASHTRPQPLKLRITACRVHSLRAHSFSSSVSLVPSPLFRVLSCRRFRAGIPPVPEISQRNPCQPPLPGHYRAPMERGRRRSPPPTPPRGACRAPLPGNCRAAVARGDKGGEGPREGGGRGKEQIDIVHENEREREREREREIER